MMQQLKILPAIMMIRLTIIIIMIIFDGARVVCLKKKGIKQ